MISYKSLDKTIAGYKYELLVNHSRQLPIDFIGHDVYSHYAHLRPCGILDVTAGYRWDGATGGADTADFMEASMYHDILCTMINNNKLSGKLWGPAASVMTQIQKEEGMSLVRRLWTGLAVRLYGLCK